MYDKTYIVVLSLGLMSTNMHCGGDISCKTQTKTDNKHFYHRSALIGRDITFKILE